MELVGLCELDTDNQRIQKREETRPFVDENMVAAIPPNASIFSEID